MPKKNPNLENLRNQVRKRHRDVTRKLSRMNRANAWDLTGTEIDPRRELGKLKKYNSKQAEAYLNKLDNFMSRDTQFVPDTRNRPVPKSTFDEYKTPERKYNAKVKRQFERIADLPMPPVVDAGGMETVETIRDRMAKITPTHRQAARNAANAPYLPPEREPKNFKNAAAMAKMAAAMKARLAPDYEAKMLAKDREVFEKMADKINRPDIKEMGRGLSDKQFQVAWNYMGLADAMKLPYEQAQKLLSSNEQATETDTMDENLREAEKLLGHAKTLGMGRGLRNNNKAE